MQKEQAQLENTFLEFVQAWVELEHNPTWWAELKQSNIWVILSLDKIIDNQIILAITMHWHW